MKITILLSFILVVLSSVSQAQIEKGRIQIGGSIGLNHQNIAGSFGSDSKYTNLNVSPSVGKFYQANKMAGVFLNFAYVESTNNIDYVARSYGGGIFFRQYQPIAKSLYVLFDERGMYNYQSVNENSSSGRSYNINASVQAGLAYDLTKKMQLELMITNLLNAGYSNGSGYTSYANGKSYSIGSSLEGNPFSNISLGFRFYLK